jgi:hypothetical protein
MLFVKLQNISQMSCLSALLRWKFAKLRLLVSPRVSISLSECNNPRTAEGIFINCDTGEIYRNVETFQF